MGIFSSAIISNFDNSVDDLLNNNITYLRVDIPDYQNAAVLAQSKAAVIRAIAKGANIIWGVSSNKFNNAAYEITAANWGDFHDAILAAATWAEENGVYEFQLGNEEELHNDNTTLTDTQLIINLKALATEVQAIFTRGNVSYSCAQGFVNNWVTLGKGDLDILASNIYIGGIVPFTNAWKTDIDNLLSAFGVNGTYLTEFSLSYTSLDSYSSDEETQANIIQEMVNYIKDRGILRAMFYTYTGDTFGVRKADGTYRKLWDVLKIQNDWKKRKTAGQEKIRGLSHG